MKSTKNQKGFTLIELLVVIAIIGILASVVLASLNTARNKGGDAATKSNLANLRPQAELYYSDHNLSYTGICSDTKFNSGVTAAAATCIALADTWAVSAPLKTNTNTSWCVDSTGKSSLGTANTTTGLCDASGGDTSGGNGGSSSIPVTSINLNENNTTIVVGGTSQLTFTIAPSNATNQNVTWLSSNTNVATVNNGLVTAISSGSATITVMATDTTNGTLTATNTLTATGGSGGGDLTWASSDGPINNWSSATDYCPSSLGTGWRLPTIGELVALYDVTGSTPPGFVAGYYWSSTTVPSNTAYAYVMSFYDGRSTDYSDKNTTSTYVRCVR